VDSELPLQDSNLDYLIQSGGPRAPKTDNLTGKWRPDEHRRPVGL